MKFTDILTWIIIVIFVYLIYLWFFGSSDKSKLSTMHDATTKLVIDPNTIPTSTTSNFSFSICIYVDDWNYNFSKEKPIFTRTVGKDTVCPKVEFDAFQNNITISLAVYDTTGSSGSKFITETVTIENVPLQKWTNLLLTVNGRALDIYLDGKLVSTKILHNSPSNEKTKSIVLTPNGGFSGSTANFVYYNKSINPREAYNIYKEGCGSTSWLGDIFNRYKLKLSFLKDNQIVNSFTV